MGFLVTKKTTINGETKVTTYAETDELEAKRRYHSTLAQAYDKKDGLEHLLCTLENDYGYQILKENYFKPEVVLAKTLSEEDVKVANEG